MKIETMTHEERAHRMWAELAPQIQFAGIDGERAAINTAVAAFAEVERKARLDEANWWHEMNDEGNDELRRSQCCERVVQLERQAGGKE
jgi:hypothetical protein